MIRNALGPVTHTGAIPAQADVVVIGGGIVGVMAAWELARVGVSVTLIEKGRIAGEQSSRNWGWIRVQGRARAEIAITQEAQKMWVAMAPDLDCDIGLRQTGTWYVSDDEDKIIGYHDWLASAQPYGVSSQIVDMAGIQAHFKGLTSGWKAALHTPTDMRAEPFLAVPAMARAAVRAGVQIIENCAARLLETSAGQVSGVATEHGVIKTNAVILAAGAWSRLFLGNHGITLPQLSVRSSVMATDPADVVSEDGVYAPGFAFRARQDGGYTVAPAGFQELYLGPDAIRSIKAFWPQLRRDPFGTKLRPFAPKGYPDAWGQRRRWQADDISPFERMRMLDPPAQGGACARGLQKFQAHFPHLKSLQAPHRWAGMIDVLPDELPVVETSSTLPGLTIATGFSGHGFGSGPAYGRIAAQLALGIDHGFDLRSFALNRF